MIAALTTQPPVHDDPDRTVVVALIAIGAPIKNVATIDDMAAKATTGALPGGDRSRTRLVDFCDQI